MAEDKDYVWDHYEESVKVKSYTCQKSFGGFRCDDAIAKLYVT